MARLRSVAPDGVVLGDTSEMLTGCQRSHSEDTCRVSHLQDIDGREKPSVYLIFGVQNKATRINICSLKQSSPN